MGCFGREVGPLASDQFRGPIDGSRQDRLRPCDLLCSALSAAIRASSRATFSPWVSARPDGARPPEIGAVLDPVSSASPSPTRCPLPLSTQAPDRA